MIFELTEMEVKLTKMLLNEELDQIEELIKEANESDKKDLASQAEMMKSILAKLSK